MKNPIVTPASKSARPKLGLPRKPEEIRAEAAAAEGAATRKVAAEILLAVLERKRTFDDLLDPVIGHPGMGTLDVRDRALVHQLVATVLRRFGSLRAVLREFLRQGFPKETRRVEIALLLGAAQILFLNVPDHAAVDLAVDLAKDDPRAKKYTGLINAVLRRLTREGRGELARLDLALDTPAWMFAKWAATYGEKDTRAFLAMHRETPPLDITVKSDAAGWAEKLGGALLPTGSIRLGAHGPLIELPGFAEGEWWVQDAAAAIPARLFGDIAGQRVLDMCAAPGGKTCQLTQAGAIVTALDRSARRLERVEQNLARLGLTAELVCTDALQWSGEAFDAILLDAPCTATGTIRRHPDVPWQKMPKDILALANLQVKLLDKAASLLKPGGTLVFCTCSLEAEEGEEQIKAFLARTPGFSRKSIKAAEIGLPAECINAEGEMRTLPHHLAGATPATAGLDGFFAARLVKSA